MQKSRVMTKSLKAWEENASPSGAKAEQQTARKKKYHGDALDRQTKAPALRWLCASAPPPIQSGQIS
jgi:hypothetical protein